MSDMREIIVQSVSKILEDGCTKEVLENAEKKEWAEELWNILSESGVLLIGIPEEKGGVGGDYADGFHIMKLIGKFSVPLPIFETILVNWLLTNQKKEPRSTPTTFAFKKKLHIDSESEKWKINGRIEDVPWARNSNEILINAISNNKNYLIIIDTEKCQVKKNTNLAGEPLDEVKFNNIEINSDNIIEIKKSQIEQIEKIGALAKSSMMCGAMNAILQMTINYTKEREQFGRPLHKFQAIQQKLAILAGETISANTITDYAIDAFNESDFNKSVSFAKIISNETASIGSSLSHQIHGAIGTTYEHDLHFFTRRLWTWRDQFGNEDFWEDKLVNTILSNNYSLWEFLSD